MCGILLLNIAIALGLSQSESPSQTQSLPWTQLSLSTCGVDTYLSQHPELDGRGVVIAVMDTGVDMGVLGLQKTPQGETKVIDVRDFSGEGEYKLEQVFPDEATGVIIHHDSEGRPQEYTIDRRTLDQSTQYWFAMIDEKRFQNSEVPDLNGNESTDDRFGMLVAAPHPKTANPPALYVDTDGDRDLSDEKPIHDYHLHHETFQFARQRRESQIAPLTFAVNIFIPEEKVELHFDDGGHGTHVAGIAAGYQINGQKGLNGVAPGAKIISLKIGNNTLAGGATVTGSKKKAFEYAAQYARDHQVPVVCNLSYGVGSEMEGQSDFDRFLDALCLANPNLIVVSSAGNEGPGLSTIGTPTAAPAAISVAALLAADSARDVMGYQMEGPQLAVFSSRGGELQKPTFCVPGYATSTVPRWNQEGDFWRGTSMASPYAAGMAAVLVSSDLALHPKHVHRSSWVKEALTRSATPISGYTSVDQGAGIPDMQRAVQQYQKLAESLQKDVLFDHEVTTTSPLAPGGEAPAAYWRSPYYPQDHSQVFTVSPRYVPTEDAEAIASFSQQYRIESDAAWCLPRQEQVYLRGKQSARINVDYDTSKLTQPGIYVATVRGNAENHMGFELQNTVVIPHTFDLRDQNNQHINGQKVEGWRVNRHFFSVPPGATAMHLSLSAPPGQESDLRARELFKPNGASLVNYGFTLDTDSHRNEAHWTVGLEDLEPGVWEVCTYSTRPDKSAYYDVHVRFSGIQAEPAVIEDWEHEVGTTPEGSVTLTSLMGHEYPITVQGSIEGYRVELDQQLTPQEDTLTHAITFNPQIRAVRIEAEFDRSDFAHFTDVAINVFDKSGAALLKDGMSYQQTEVVLENPSPAADRVDCKLKILPAFALTDESITAELRIKLTYLYKTPVTLDFDAPDVLYPGIPQNMDFTMNTTPPQHPDGSATIGSIRILNAGTQDELIRIPIWQE